MARNLPLSKELVKLVFTLRNVNKWSFSQIGTHFGKTKQWAAYVLASYSEESLSPIVVAEYCESLYESVPKRLPMVIENYGFRIKK